MILFQSCYKSGFCEVSMHSHHEMSGNVYDILSCCQKANYIYIYLLHQCTHTRRCSKSVYTSLRANKRKQLPRCCRPSTACFLVKPVLPCSGWRPSLRVRTSLTWCVFNDVARVITIEWHLRNFENYNVLQKFPHSWFQATCIWEKNTRIYPALLVVVACIGKVHLGHAVFPFGNSDGGELRSDPKKATLTTRKWRICPLYQPVIETGYTGKWLSMLPPMQDRMEQIRKLVPCKPDAMHHASQGTKRTQASWKRPQRKAESHKMIGQSSKATMELIMEPTMERQWVLLAKCLKSRSHMGHYDLLICPDLWTLCSAYL